MLSLNKFMEETLEELIDSCGFHFRTLTLHSNGTWTCNYAKHLRPTSASNHSRYEKAMCSSKTAREAVIKAREKINKYKRDEQNKD